VSNLIRMVEEAGFSQEDDNMFICGIEHIQKLLEIERKECAKLFESYETFGEDYDSYYADKYKAMIIARGNNDV